MPLQLPNTKISASGRILFYFPGVVRAVFSHKLFRQLFPVKRTPPVGPFPFYQYNTAAPLFKSIYNQQR
jgi:hypothetical protein